MNGDMGVRKRYCVDLASQQLQQTHRKCHHRQSLFPKVKKLAAAPAGIKIAARTKAQHKKHTQLKTTTKAAAAAIATKRKYIKQQIKINNKQQYPPKHKQQKQQQYSINNIENKKQQRIPQQEQEFQIHRGQQKLATTTKHKTEKAKTRKSTKDIRNLKITTTTPRSLHQQKQQTSRSLKLLGNISLNRLWTLLLLSLTCLSSWRVVPNLAIHSSTSQLYHPKILYLSSLTSIASTLALTQTSMALAAAAAAYEPTIQYHHSEGDVEVSDGMVVEDIDVNSNEQQLLAYYKKAQKEHEQMKRQQQQQLHLQQEQQLQLQQQQRHHHQERDLKRNILMQQQQQPQQQMDFNEILPTADVISTLDTLESTSKKKSTATKRSTTKRAPSASPSPTPITGAKSLASTASSTTTTSSTTTRTTVTTTTTTTASTEEKCEPKVLDEVPAEPVS